MVMIRKRILMPKNLTKKTIKKPQKSLKKPQKAKKRPKIFKKPKKARNFKIAKKAQKSPKKPEFFWVIQFRIVQNELWCTWGFFFIEAVKKSPGIKILSLLITYEHSFKFLFM